MYVHLWILTVSWIIKRYTTCRLQFVGNFIFFNFISFAGGGGTLLWVWWTWRHALFQRIVERAGFFWGKYQKSCSTNPKRIQSDKLKITKSFKSSARHLSVRGYMRVSKWFVCLWRCVCFWILLAHYPSFYILQLNIC